MDKQPENTRQGLRLLWQSPQSRLYSPTKVTIPVNKFWLKLDSWYPLNKK